ncbi:MAG: hypothetical protein R3B84_06790 [Zavarzinella sp.]
MCIIRLLIVLALLHASHAVGLAGWLGFRNGSSQKVIVQESFQVGESVQFNRPKVLYKNELLRDAAGKPGQVRIFRITTQTNPPLTTTVRVVHPPEIENHLYQISLIQGKIHVEIVK